MTTPTKNPDWDRVDQASLESFPASDPPAWGSSHAFASAETACPEGTGPATSKVMMYVKRIGTGLVALGALFVFVETMRRVRSR